MHNQLHPAIALAVVGAVILTATIAISKNTWEASSQAEVPADQVLASFERELNHEAAPAQAVTRDSIEHDVLYRTINSVHWTKEGQTPASKWPCRQTVRGSRDGNLRNADCTLVP